MAIETTAYDDRARLRSLAEKIIVLLIAQNCVIIEPKLPDKWEFDLIRNDAIAGLAHIRAQQIGDVAASTIIFLTEQKCRVIADGQVTQQNIRDEVIISGDRLTTLIDPECISLEERDPVGLRVERISSLFAQALQSNLEGWKGTYGAGFTV